MHNFHHLMRDWMHEVDAGRLSNGEFFAALIQDGCYVCGDTATDPRLAIIYATYLRPTNAQAMLVAAFGANGRTQGLISCVHAAPRKWLPAEITALRKCAAEVSLHRARRRTDDDAQRGLGRRVVN